ncbi:MAG: tetratricopeptide repeat protein [Salinivirgaceae bacterium]|jgi:tetratricopeptide (TPR) repeat protein
MKQLIAIIYLLGSINLYAQNDSVQTGAEENEVQLYIKKGCELITNQEYEKAITAFTLAIENKSDDTEALIKRANVYVILKQFELANHDYNTAIYLEKNQWQSYLGRGTLKFYEDKHDEALKDLLKAKDLKCLDAELFYFLGALLFELGDYESAHTYYSQCISINTNHFFAYNDRGSTLRMMGLYSNAITDYKKAIELKPDFTLAYTNLGSTYWRNGNLDEASIAYQNAIQIKPDMVLAYINRAGVKIDKNDFEGALVDCKKALEIDSNYAPAYNNQGAALLKMNRLSDAAKSFTLAIEIEPTNGIAYLNRGICYEKEHNIKLAVEDWKKAAALGIQKAKNYIDFYE